MKILVTGGTGFIGSHTAVALAEAGHELRLLVRSPEKARRVFEALGAELPECTEGDVTDADSVEAALEGCEGVFHAAALVALDARHAREVARTNLDGTRHVVGGARRRGLGPILYVSSTAALFHPGGPPIGPDTEPASHGDGGYARSKAETERWLRDLQAEGARVAATYPVGVLGPHAPSLTELHRSLPLQLRVMPFPPGGMNFVDVRDLAAIHREVFARPPESARWMAGGPFVPWSELPAILEDVTGRRIPSFGMPGGLMRGLGRLGDAVKRVAPFDLPLSHEAMVTATRWPGVDSSATTAELGVAFRDLRETFADTLAWMHAEGHLPAKLVGRLADRRA